MEIQTLRDFVAVVQENGISAAADMLHINQPTLSRRIDALEKELGTRLFERGNRAHGITLTTQGTLFYRRAREITELADRASAEMHRCNEIAGPVHIAAAQSEVMRFIGQAATQTHVMHPAVTFDLHDGNGIDNTERLDHGLADFAVLIQPVDMSRYDHLALPGGEIMGVLMREDDPLCEYQSISPELLSELPLLMPQGTLARRDISGWAAQSPDVKPYTVVGTMNLTHNAAYFVQAGYGYAVVLQHTSDAGKGSGLAFRPLNPPLHVHLSIAWRKECRLSPACEAFLTQLRNILSNR